MSIQANKTSATTVTFASPQEIVVSHLDDSIKIGDGTDLLAINADGSLNVNLSPQGTSINVFSEVSSVSISSTTDILTYTVPVGKTLILTRVEFGGTNIATYEILFNDVVNGRKRTYFGGALTDCMGFEENSTPGLRFNAADTIKIRVINYRPSVADFEARLQATLLG